MRHKQRPVKSSRHKSVTFIIDSSQTSFIDNNNHNHHQQEHRQQHHQHFQAHQNEQFHQYDDYNQSIDNDNDDSHLNNHQNHRQNNTNINVSYDNNNVKHHHYNQSSASDRGSPYMRKQAEHNVRHMSDIMRLAFLENNDICPETWGDVDFNSLSTASILQRNIQHQLQQQRREQQIQSRQKQQQLHLQQLQHQQQQQSRHWQTQKSQSQHLRQNNAYLVQEDQQYQHDGNDIDDDDYQTFSDVDIFATAMPTTSSSSNRQIRNISSTPRATSSNYIENDNARKPIRVREVQSSLSQQDLSSHSAQEVDMSPINHGDGFLCDDPGCGKSFSSLRKLRHHKVVHSDEFPFVCQFKGCGKKFKRKFGIDLHSTTHFDLDPDMYNKTSNNSSLPFFGRRMQYSMCKPCGQKFKTVHEYQYHMLKHGKEPFKCPVKGCGQTFSIWKSFQKHRASHYFNYYCKMDARCNHHTSNLQLLKLHIYCCHFRRHLPENATLSSKDRAEEEDSKDERIDVVDNGKPFCEPIDSMETEIEPNEEIDGEEEELEEGEREHEDDRHVEIEDEQISVEEDVKPVMTTSTRRDARLRENPPRSSTFGRQDYASLNNGKSFAKISPSTPSGSKRTRASLASGGSQSHSEHSHQQQDYQLQPHQNHQQHQPHRRAREQQHRYREDFDDDDDDDDHDQDDFHDAQDDDYEESNDRIFGATSSMTPSSKHSTPSKATSSSGANKNKKTARGKEISPRTAPAAQSSQSMREEMIPINYGEGFYCDEPGCGKSFPSVRKLRHHKVVHSDEFPFVCQFKGCGKKFKRKFGIDLHSTTHFDLDPDMYNKTSNNSSLPFFGRRMQYSMCKPCGQKFKTVHEYQYHMLKHGKEPFKCPVKGCGQTFSIWKSFQKHRASHYFNYYCKMDPGCDHHTSNLQLLKLHIYCCHFRRVLPPNATLSSKDRVQEDGSRPEVSVDVDVDDSELQLDVDGDNRDYDTDAAYGESEVQIPKKRIKLEPSSTATQEPMQPEPKSEPTTPRRDSRLRKNPPRSSAYSHQDYASVNNGKGLTKSSSSSTPTTSNKRTRASTVATGTCNAQSSPEKKPKLPLKVLPKRSAQRLPMSLLAADDGSTEDDDEDDDQAHSSGDESSLGRSRDLDSGGGGGGAHHEEGGDDHEDPTGRSRFRCHLCDFKFNVRFQLTKHLSTHLELTSDMYLATADMKVIKLSERRRREFFCDKCNLKFEQMSDLDVHMRKHGQRPYVCNFCPQRSTFRLAKQYLSHLYEHRFIYKCLMDPKCEFTINRKDALKLHVFRMHLNQKLPSYLENYATIFNENEF